MAGRGVRTARSLALSPTPGYYNNSIVSGEILLLALGTGAGSETLHGVQAQV